MKESSLIEEVLKPELIFRLSPQRSKIVRTRVGVTRIAITDPSMVEVNEFGNTEFELIGLRAGETTMTMWFTDEAGQVRRLRYLVQVAANEAELLQAEYEFGKIERRMNELFPNSQIRLIPVADKLIIRGLDVGLNWTAALADLGLESLPGSVSVSMTGNYLMDQIQRYAGSPDKLADYAGFNGASRIRGTTSFGYNWGRNRAVLTWQYRLGTQTPTTYAATPNITRSQAPTVQRNPLMAGYRTFNQLNGTFGTRIGPVNASLSISNMLNTKPSWGGYDLRDPMNGFGSFSPFDDLVGRRYSLNLSVDL